MMRLHASMPDIAAAERALAMTIGATHVKRHTGPERGAGLLVSPGSTEEVAAVVLICRDLCLSIVPEGGCTGLVGGCQSHSAQIGLSLARMDRVEAIHPDERVVVVQAGAALEAVQTAAMAYGLEPGIDLAARGTATIGGMVSTNAGGIMAHRYGVMRHRVLGLEAVLPDGQIYSDMTRVVKNTAGYDLKHLFIGAEGTLGIVTRVVLKLEPAPQATATLLLGLPSVASAMTAIRLALSVEHGYLRAAEGLWQNYMQLTAAARGWSEPSFPLDQSLNLLLMLGGAGDVDLQSDAERIFGVLTKEFPSVTGIIATSSRQEAELWRLREDTDQLYRKYEAAPSFDVSVPQSEIAAYVDHVRNGLAKLDGGISPYLFGHLADGNLHIVLDRCGPLDRDLTLAVETVLYAPLEALGGSFSAEHGIGSRRVHTLLATANPAKLDAMRRIKQLLDPENSINPGKVLPLMKSENPK